MKKFVKITLLSILLLGLAKAEVVDCRVIVGEITECNPYTKRFLKAKEINYGVNRKKLIVDRVLPKPKKHHIKVISIADMIERYVKVEESLRFKGAEDKAYFKILKHKKRLPEETTSVQEENRTVAQISDMNKTKEAPIPVPSDVVEKSIYKVRKGDTLSNIALMFNMKIKDIVEQNGLQNKDQLHIGQKLTLPISEKKLNAIVTASYRVEKGDTLLGIAKKFNLDPKELAKFNNIKTTSQIKTDTILRLPLPYKIAEMKAKKKAQAFDKAKKASKSKLIREFGKRRLRVTATAYTSHHGQTDSTPFLAAWNNRLRPGMKSIAVSRDLLTKYGMRNGTKVRIGGLPGIYRVRDKMNKRYKKRIDIYMGTDRQKALRWGRRSVIIYW